MNNQEPTNKEILEAVNVFAGSVEQRFDGVDKRLNKIEALMVTKSYLDDKLADLRGDLVVLTRKEDRKLAELVNVLQEKKVIDANDAKRVLAMEPFPQISL